MKAVYLVILVVVVVAIVVLATRKKEAPAENTNVIKVGGHPLTSIPYVNFVKLLTDDIKAMPAGSTAGVITKVLRESGEGMKPSDPYSGLVLSGEGWVTSASVTPTRDWQVIIDMDAPGSATAVPEATLTVPGRMTKGSELPKVGDKLGYLGLLAKWSYDNGQIQVQMTEGVIRPAKASAAPAKAK